MCFGKSATRLHNVCTDSAAFCQCLGSVGATISSAGQFGDHSPNVSLPASQCIKMYGEERRDAGGTKGQIMPDHQSFLALVVSLPVALLYFLAIPLK